MGLSEQIREELSQGRTPEEIVERLLRKGMSEATARKFVEKAQAEPAGAGPTPRPTAPASPSPTARRSPRAAAPPETESGDDGRWPMVRGAFFFSLGVLATGLTYVLAKPGEKYLLLYGAVVAGLIDFGRGLARWWEVRASQPFPVLLVGGGVLVPVLIMGGVLVMASRQRAQRKEDIVNAVRAEEERRGIKPAAGKEAPLDPVSAYIVALKKGNPDTRRESAWRLGEMKERAHDAVPALLAALSDPAASVRESTGAALMKIDPQNAAVVTAVKALFQDPALDVWSRTAGAFARDGDADAISVLPAKLDHSEVWWRERAVSTLGSLGEKGTAAVPLLARKLKEDPDYRVRVACARALGRLGMGAPSVKQALTAAGSDEHPFVQTAAKEALATLERK